MAEAAASASAKKLIRIDVSSDSVCPWCFVGKRNLDKAISASRDQFDFEVHFLYSLCKLNPNPFLSIFGSCLSQLAYFTDQVAPFLPQSFCPKRGCEQERFLQTKVWCSV